MVFKEKFGKLYDKHYLILTVVPILILALSMIYLGNFYSKNGDFLLRDSSLTGGTAITINDPAIIEDFLTVERLISEKFNDINFKRLTDIRTGSSIALVVESSLDPDTLKGGIEEALGIELTSDNSSTEFSGPSISQSFYRELMQVVLLSFVLMGVVVFIIFGDSGFLKSLVLALSILAIRLTFPFSQSLLILVIVVGLASLIYSFVKMKKVRNNYLLLSLATIFFLTVLFYPSYYLIFVLLAILLIIYTFNSVPSIAVILAAFSNLVMSVAIIDILGVKISSAGLVAFLMIIGYSVDTDILLTNHALRGFGSLNSRIFSAFKTGIFMTLTALAAVLPAFLLITGLPDSFRQIFLVVTIGLAADIFNTWLTNAGIIKWYCKRKGIN